MKSKEAIERHIKELLSEMTVEEKLDELDPNIMGIDWEKIEEPMRRECLEKLEKRRADARVYNALQKYAKEQTRLGIPFLFHEEALHGLHRRDATIFPQQLTLAGAFEPALCEDMGRMVAAETRAKNIHEGTYGADRDLSVCGSGSGCDQYLFFQAVHQSDPGDQ